ncbi:MAG: hypothetical protein LBJ00_13385 [Planctomycetaceae bacterium]|jgi:hypothetical protein|nr:hypothetical protein [Planctomycetaceae bacterium]
MKIKSLYSSCFKIPETGHASVISHGDCSRAKPIARTGFGILFIFLVLFLCIGCSSKVKVSGKITFSDDGSPLTKGTVCFQTGTFVARGNLQSDGVYRMSSVNKNDGLPSGTYRISVINAVDGLGEDDAVQTPLIDPKYNNIDTSGITFEVTSSSKRFDFTVDRPKPAQK